MFLSVDKAIEMANTIFLSDDIICDECIQLKKEYAKKYVCLLAYRKQGLRYPDGRYEGMDCSFYPDDRVLILRKT